MKKAIANGALAGIALILAGIVISMPGEPLQKVVLCLELTAAALVIIGLLGIVFLLVVTLAEINKGKG